MALNSSSEFILRDYLKIIFRYKILIIIIAVLVTATVLLRRELVTPQYTASVKMLIYGTPNTEETHYTSIQHPRGLVGLYSEMLKSKSVMERVVRTLKLDNRPIDEEMQYATKLKKVLTKYRMQDQKLLLAEMDPGQKQKFLFNNAVGRLRSMIGTTYDQDSISFIYMIHVRDYNPSAAIAIANAVARSFVVYSLEQEIVELKLRYGEKHTKILELERYIDEIVESLDVKLIPENEAWGPASIKILEQAQTAFPVAGMSNTRVIIIFLVSLAFGCFIAYIFDLLDQTFRTPHDIEKHLHIPFLGSIPEKKAGEDILMRNNNAENSDYMKAYQTISDQLFLIMKIKNQKSLSIVSTDSSGNTPFQIANLGIYLARKAGHKVLIIDADLRSPSLNTVFQISNSLGLNEILEGKASLYDVVQSPEPNLYVVTAGEAVHNSVILLNSSVMSELIEKSKASFDLILVNSGYMNNITDATTIAAFTESITIVLNEGKDRRHIVEKAIAHLREQNDSIIGVILNNRKYVIPQIIYKFT